MSTRDIFWGKDGRCVGLTVSPPSSADCLEIPGTSYSWRPKGQFSFDLYLYQKKCRRCWRFSSFNATHIILILERCSLFRRQNLPRYSRRSLSLMQNEGSSPYAQESFTCPQFETYKFSSRYPNLLLQPYKA
jgi:hypothetical protein